MDLSKLTEEDLISLSKERKYDLKQKIKKSLEEFPILFSKVLKELHVPIKNIENRNRIVNSPVSDLDYKPVWESMGFSSADECIEEMINIFRKSFKNAIDLQKSMEESINILVKDLNYNLIQNSDITKALIEIENRKLVSSFELDKLYEEQNKESIKDTSDLDNFCSSLLKEDLYEN